MLNKEMLSEHIMKNAGFGFYEEGGSLFVVHEISQSLLEAELYPLENKLYFHITVNKAWQRKGLGLRLVEMLQCIGLVTGITECIGENVPYESLAFYSKCGFCVKESDEGWRVVMDLAKA